MRLTTRSPVLHRPPLSTTTSRKSASPRIRSSRRWRRRFLLTAAVAVLIPVLAAPAAHAATAPSEVLALAKDANTVLNNIRNWIMGILATLATVMLTVGGLRYLLAAGDPGEVEKAKTAFKSAGYGYALAALAPLVVEILKGIVGAN